MAIDNVFGSGDLTPELLRSASFAELDGRYDAAEVRTFLDRVASALETFLAADAPSALRAEFRRNAEIAQQVLDAGQQAAEQLRRQAADEARALLDDTRDATAQLRAGVEGELRESHAQLEQMRGQFISDLRDLYDRIGASLYRFERAEQERPAMQAPAVSEPVAAEPSASALPEGALPPAWQQLAPAEPMPFEPEPEPEPLVDLRDMPIERVDIGTGVDDAAAAADPPATFEAIAVPGGSWLDDVDAAADIAGAAATEPAPAEQAGSWLDAGPDGSLSDIGSEDARAEALAAGEAAAVETGLPGEPSPDAAAVRQLILDALASGQPRESIEAYLRDQLGLVEPGMLIDAALASGLD